MRRNDLVGQKIGRLKVISCYTVVRPSGRKKLMFSCLCDCGDTADIESNRLKTSTRSCGCLHSESTAAINFRHGEAKKSKEYKAWAGCKDRCYNSNNEKYPNYGARGIKVCDRWINSYEAFLNDVGRAPSKQHSLDRINVNGDYEPINCKWSTSIEQGRNKTTSVNITHKGETYCMSAWCTKLNIPYKTVHALIKYHGQSFTQVLARYGKL